MSDVARPPEELTSFVGREAELAEVTGLIAQRRLVTLTGVGGCGKTRLAARVADRAGPSWQDGTRFVDLGPVTDPSLVPATVASAVGVAVEPGGDQMGRLAAQLHGRRLLIWLDTCEHLLDAVGELVAALLTRSPGTSVLATSREPLGIAGEMVWRVPSLRPDEAARLFAERATLVAPGFDADRAGEHVAAVCARVDHLPLAIELAAAWVRALTPVQIDRGLDDSFRLLVGGPRNAVARHQTLQASMAWSHALLDDEERRLFRRVSVFAGAFTLEAARAVAGDDTGAGGSGLPDTLVLVSRLLDASLVTVREVGGELRYRMLDTVRQFAGAELRAAGEAEAVRDRHLDYFLALAEEAEAGMDVDQDRWRIVLEGHRPDIGAALRWGLSQPPSPPPGQADRGRRLAAAMARQWLVHGHIGDGLQMLESAAGLAPREESALQARLYAGQTMLGMAAGRLTLVTEAARRGARIAELAGDEPTRARCLAFGAFREFFSDFERCEEQTRAAQSAAENAGEPFGRDWAATVEAYSLLARNRNEEAVAVARPAFYRSRSRNDRFCAAFARGVEIFTLLLGGDVPAAVAVGREVVDMARPLRDYFAVGTLTCNAAYALAMSGALEEARTLMEPIVGSLDTAREADVVGFMVPYGLVHLWEGRLDEAVEWFEKGVARLGEHGRDWTAARCFPGLVGALRRSGRREEAALRVRQGLRQLRAFGGWYEYADALDEHGRLVAGDDPAKARELHVQALVARRDNGVRLGYADSLDALARLAAEAGDAEEAARLCGAGESARSAMGYPRHQVDRRTHEEMIKAVRAAVEEARFRAAWEEGAAADLDVLVAARTRGRGTRTQAPGLLGALTPTELDVARLAGDGLSNPQIAERLYMSRSTVKAHLARMYAKLGLSNRTELATLLRSEMDGG